VKFIKTKIKPLKSIKIGFLLQIVYFIMLRFFEKKVFSEFGGLDMSFFCMAHGASAPPPF